MLYPLKFQPILKEKIWGGNKLHSKSYNVPVSKKIGESWEISAVEGEVSVVLNGKFKGKDLQELIKDFENQLLGDSVFRRFKYEFPILIKFIEARKNLSVQLHPDDKLAKERHNSFGKTEMWYIIETDDDAKLTVDFKESISIERYKKLLDEGNLQTALNSFEVKEGDTFFIKPGIVHSIGAGILLAEIQQTSDITYRIYDWNRTDANGKPRELHTDLALDAIDFTNKSEHKISYKPELNSKVLLADTPYFKTNYLEIEGSLDLDYSSLDSFVILMNVGIEDLFIIHNGVKYSVSAKETILIPASLHLIRLESKTTKVLEISI
jgi:mannose-6-phosphate isomerase